MTVFAQGFGVSFAKTVSAVYRRDNPVQALKQRIASRRIALKVTSAGANVYRPTNTSRVPCLLTPHWCPARVRRRGLRVTGPAPPTGMKGRPANSPPGDPRE